MSRMAFVGILSAVAVLLGTESSWAGHRGCGGCGHSRGGHRHGHCGRHHGCGGHHACGGSYGCGSGGGGCYAWDGVGSSDRMVAATEAPAILVVRLPEEAQLTVDGQAMVSTSDTRVLVSPPLEPGKDFYYTLQASVVRNGQPQSVSQEVTVRAGVETQVTLDIPAATVAAR